MHTLPCSRGQRHEIATHHFEVFRGTWFPTEQAGEQHFPDVMPSSVRELQHAEGFWLEVAEICLLLQDLHLLLISHLGVWDLVPEEKTQFSHVAPCTLWLGCWAHRGSTPVSDVPVI